MGQAIKQKLLSSIPFWVCSSVTIILFVLGFIVPPTGQIDPTVLTAGAELFAFATLAVVADAIRYGYDAKVSHGNTTIEVTNNDEREAGVEVKTEEK